MPFNRDKRPAGGKGFKKRDGDSRGFGGGRSFGGGRDSDRDSRPHQMYDAVCSECGNSCQVPFHPTGDRPVFCSQCFGAQDRESFDRPIDRPRGKSFDRSARSDRPSFGDKRMYDAVCADCGNDCQVPFRPNGEKPVYCSQCFDKDNRSAKPDNSRGKGPGPDQFKQQFEMLNNKLDKILRALNPVKEAEIAPEEKAPKKTAEVKTAVKKAVKKKKK